MKIWLLLGCLAFCAARQCRADELAVAREALRDGLGDIARNHAAKAEGDAAKLVILESYAREAKWEALLKALDGWEHLTGDGFTYYRALALAESDRAADAQQTLDGVQLTDATYVQLAAKLRARLALAKGDPAEALKILRDSGFGDGDDASRMEAADILEAAGRHEDAVSIWRELVAKTNASEKVFVTAAVNLGERAPLLQAYDLAKTPTLKRLAGLRAGLVSLRDGKTFDEGAALIRALVKDAPDTEGAEAAYLALADASLASERYAEAADLYASALEMWPKTTAFDSAVQEGRGWALRKLGKGATAAEAFAKARDVAKTDADRARTALELGDTLSELGRGGEALEQYRLVLDKYPETDAGKKLAVQMRLRDLEARGCELIRNYDFDGASKVFAELAELDPARKARADYFEMLCLFGRHQDDAVRAKARAILDDAGADARIRAETTLWLAKFEYNNGRWGDARALFLSFAEMEPSSLKAPSALVWAARAAFAQNEFTTALGIVSRLVEKYPNAPERLQGYIVQAESLIELTRFQDAVTVLDRAVRVEGASATDRLKAKILRADALFAQGADNQVCYQEALDAYRALKLGEALPPDLQLIVSIKIARTLEKLKRTDEAFDAYYADVVVAYRKGRLAGIRYDDETRAAFARAAFRLADEYERRGRDQQALNVLALVRTSDVPAAREAVQRIERLQAKGKPQ